MLPRQRATNARPQKADRAIPAKRPRALRVQVSHRGRLPNQHRADKRRQDPFENQQRRIPAPPESANEQPSRDGAEHNQRACFMNPMSCLAHVFCGAIRSGCFARLTAVS